MSTMTIMTCLTALIAVDGDTIKCDNQNLRPMGNGSPYVEGFDTPEIRGHEKCKAERMLGELATKRMAQYLETHKIIIEDSGKLDPYKRPLVVLRLSDGSTIGQHMIDEGYAKKWIKGQKVDWCNSK